MEDDHEEVPVSVTEVPEDPVNGVRAEDDGQHTHRYTMSTTELVKAITRDTNTCSSKQSSDQKRLNSPEIRSESTYHSEPAGHVVHQPVDGLKDAVQHRVRAGQHIEVLGLQQQPPIVPQILYSARPLSASPAKTES